jgi:rhomboid protease GluP
MIPFRKTHSREQADEWVLVLSSESIPYSVEMDETGWVIYVDSANAEKAENLLEKYAQENREWLSEEERTGGSKIILSALIVSAVLVGIYFLMKASETSERWYQVGSASAEHIVSGEWWRTVTALFLHANLLHVLSNAAFCWLFCSAVVRLYGAGLGWLLILASGAFGNLLTAYVYRTGHLSVGASTALFGAAGLLGVWRFSAGRKVKFLKKRAWVYLAAVVALIAFLGAGERVDLLGHLSGGVAGCFFGYFSNRLFGRPIPKSWQLVLVFIDLCAVLLAGLFAVSHLIIL